VTTSAAGALRRLVVAVAVFVPPMLVTVLTAPLAFMGGTLRPWNPQMIDLDVYRRAGALLLSGATDIYSAPNGELPFLYPPFAAVMGAVWSIPAQHVAQVLWLALNVLALLAILYRLGLRTWVLSLVAAACCGLVPPVKDTLAFGQLGIFLVALPLCDLVVGPRLLPWRRLLPEGFATGFAAAIKLTPLIFAPYLLLVRRFRAAVGTVLSFLGLTLLSAALLPGASRDFFVRLAHGDTGLGDSIAYYTNQSIVADWVRMTGRSGAVASLGLVLGALVALLGILAGVRWYRLGYPAFALCLVGMAGLIASPVSWSHHFVWVVPLAVVAIDRTLPPVLRALSWLVALWMVAQPFTQLPHGGNLEYAWTPLQDLLGSVTALVTIALLVAAVAVPANRRAVRVEPVAVS
jgi:alpha-1,2-mannosyltransferase